MAASRLPFPWPCFSSRDHPNTASSHRHIPRPQRRRGEDAVRASGLGYTVVRPGPLLEEPGGYKALVFDQGGRIAQAISCADVADVALKVHSQMVPRHRMG